MLSNPPVTGITELDNYLKSIKKHLEEAIRPAEGWRLSDFSADVSEVISDKRDLIDIVTHYDDVTTIKSSVEQELARYEAVISDSKVLGGQYRDYAETFTHIMEWWDQNYKIIEDAQTVMAEKQKASDFADAAKDSATSATGSAAAAASSATAANNSRVSAAGSAQAAGAAEVAAEGWAEQSKDAATLAITAAATTTQYVGDGSPEGKVTAPVGAIYTDRQATGGAIRWIKTQGTGATGWIVLAGTTGPRLVTSLIEEGVGWDISGNVAVRLTRTGETVTLVISALGHEGGESGYVRVLDLPPGFRPNTNHFANTWRGIRTYMRTSGWVDWLGPSSSVDYWSFSFETSDPWPTTLPGTPA